MYRYWYLIVSKKIEITLYLVIPILEVWRKEKQIMADSNISKITRNHYLVKSQDKTYNVRRLVASDVWTCQCRDFHYRLRTQSNKDCKHIISCHILRDAIKKEKKIELTDMNIVQACPKCFSTTLTKEGFRHLKNDIKRQRHRCRQCKYRFVLVDAGFMNMRTNPQIVSESLNLIMSNMSYGAGCKTYLFGTQCENNSYLN